VLRFFGLLALLLLAGCQRPASVQTKEDGTPKAVIQIKKISNAGGHQFEVIGTDAYKMNSPADHFTVHVVGPDGPSALAIVGEYAQEPNHIVFTPRYPLELGIRYRAVFRAAGLAEPVTAEIELPKAKVESTTVIEQVYPSGSVLPENLLRFYVQFSAPMGRGNVYKHVHLIDDKGKEIDLPFLELDEEFWDPQQKRFTLFFDPGRIKRGVKPREDLGPALEEGRSYRLVIDKAWQDARGAPLKESFVKAFKVVAPDNASPDPKKWKLEPPPAGSTEPLILNFPKPLDRAMLHRLLLVVDAEGQRLPGRITVSDEETRWRFQPEKPWAAGAYQIVAATTLEDRSGNSIERPFEVDVFHPIQKKIQPGEVKLPFTVAAK
jgi:hypothetical protein